jgi:hypothetical protein
LREQTVADVSEESETKKNSFMTLAPGRRFLATVTATGEKFIKLFSFVIYEMFVISWRLPEADVSSI